MRKKAGIRCYEQENGGYEQCRPEKAEQIRSQANDNIKKKELNDNPYLADFCFTTPSMILAKADGKNIWPILLHAVIHAVLMGLCLLVFGVPWKLILPLMLAELVSHFLIDTAKGRLTAQFPLLANQKRKSYWMLYGFDQLLHQGVIVGIWYYVTT